MRRRALYTPVDSSDSEEETELSEREVARRKWVRRLRSVWRKITAAMWVAATCFMIYYTNFFRVIWEHPSIEKTGLYLGFACMSFNVMLLFFFAVYCDWWLGIKTPWETTYPKAIPVMSITGIITFLAFAVAFWPVWGFWSLLIQFMFFMGFLNSAQFLPSGAIGSVMMFVILIGAFFTSELIPHEGLAHYK